MKIRNVRESDLATIHQIESANFSEAEAGGYEVIKSRIQKISDTFLVAEIAGEIAGYIEGPVIDDKYLTDDLFQAVTKNQATGGYIAVTSLSVDQKFQDQSVGKQLIAALKALAVKQLREGITLTCHDYLIAYYEKNGFVNAGKSKSVYGNAVWYDMIWENH